MEGEGRRVRWRSPFHASGIPVSAQMREQMRGSFVVRIFNELDNADEK